MRSFVLWFEEDETIDNSKSEERRTEKRNDIDIHINQWQSKLDRSVNYFDFGFFIKDIRSKNRIFFFIPFDIEYINQKDLCDIICGSEQARLVNAIFNDNFHISSIENPKCTIVNKNNGKDEKFIIYSLSDEQLKLRKEDKGSIIEIDLSKVKKDSKIFEYYFRFRLEFKDGGNVIKKGVSETSILQTLFTRIEIIDFRLNDVRSSLKSVVEKYLNGSHFNIKKIHYLILRNEKDEFLFHGGGINSRVLEDELWHMYFFENKKKRFKFLKNQNSDIIAYHLKEKSETEIESYSKLVRFRYSIKTIKSILLFLLWTFLIMLGSALICIGLEKIIS